MKAVWAFAFGIIFGIVLFSMVKQLPRIATKWKYSKGDSVIVVKLVEKIVKDTKFISTIDTIYSQDTLLERYSTTFNLQADSCSAYGKISFVKPAFIFSDVKIRYPEKQAFRVDTLRIDTKEIIEKRVWWEYGLVLAGGILIGLVR